MQVPRLVKIVVNMGVGRATQQRSLLDGAVTDLTIITGQKPLVRKAKKSIATFKLREGNEIGAKVTLARRPDVGVLRPAVSLAIPRIRDFRGMPPEAVRRTRQLHVRSHRAAGVPGDRLRQDRHRSRHEHHDRDHSAKPTTRPCAAPRARLPVPPRRAGVESNGQEGTRQQAAAQAEVQGARLHALPPLRSARARCTATSGCAASACGRWRTPGRSPA